MEASDHIITVLYMLASFGLVFGFQNKLPWPVSWLQSTHPLACLLQDWLGCAYCLGFWMGWVTGVAYWATLGFPIFKGGPVIMVLIGIAWALSSSVWCLLMDTILRRLEVEDDDE